VDQVRDTGKAGGEGPKLENCSWHQLKDIFRTGGKGENVDIMSQILVSSFYFSYK